MNKIYRKSIAASALVLISFSSSGLAPKGSGPSAKAIYQSGSDTVLQKLFKMAKSGVDQEAVYYLAKTLDRQELRMMAAIYFRDLIRQGPSGKFFNDAIKGLSNIDQDIRLNTSFLGSTFRAKIDEKKLLKESRSIYAYVKAEESFRLQKFKEAMSYFSQVSQSDARYNEALFMQAVIINALGQKNKAIELFRKVADLASPKSRMLDQANLNIARINYEKRDFEESIAYYAKISRNSPFWLTAIFESSWDFLVNAKPNNTLGNIHTLHSPFFAHRFFPESYILEAISYLRLCRYEKVKEAMNNFKDRYVPIMNDLKNILQNNLDDKSEFLKIVVEFDNRIPNKHHLSDPIIHILSQTDLYRDNKKISEIITEEIAYIRERYKNNGSFSSDLIRVASSERKTLEQELARKLYREGTSYSDYLVDLYDQTKLITAELMLGKVDALRSKLKIDSSKKRSNFIGGLQPLVIGQKLEYWPFEAGKEGKKGEYWQDELGGYVYNIESKCS